MIHFVVDCCIALLTAVFMFIISSGQKKWTGMVFVRNWNTWQTKSLVLTYMCKTLILIFWLLLTFDIEMMDSSAFLILQSDWNEELM